MRVASSGRAWRIFVAVLVLAVVVLGPAPAHADLGALSQEQCDKLGHLARDWEFRSASVWIDKQAEHCCEWPGVSCGYAGVALDLFSVSGHATGDLLTLPFTVVTLELAGDVTLPPMGPVTTRTLPSGRVVVDTFSELDMFDVVLTVEMPADAKESEPHHVQGLAAAGAGSVGATGVTMDAEDISWLICEVIYLTDCRVVGGDAVSFRAVPRNWIAFVGVTGVRSVHMPPTNTTSVQSALTLTGMPDLEVLSGDVSSFPSLHVHNATKMHGLTAKLSHSMLTLSGMPQLHSLPELHPDTTIASLIGINMAGKVKSLVRATKLTILTLEDCNLDDRSLPPLPPRLTTLRLDKNRLTTLPPLPAGLDILSLNDNANLTRLPPIPESLLSLSVSNCGLNGLLDVSAATHLGELNASGNNLTALHFAVASTIDVSWNQLEEITTVDGYLPDGVVELYVSHNRLRSLYGNNQASVHLPTRLAVLDASHNLFTSLGATVFPATLERVDVSHNMLTALPRFQPVKQVVVTPDAVFHDVGWIDMYLSADASFSFEGKSVLASHNEIEHVDFTILRSSSLPVTGGLEEVDLSHNKLTRWEAIAELMRDHEKFLVSLNLAHNALSFEGIDMFPIALDNLREINLDDNKFSGPLPRIQAPSLDLFSAKNAGFGVLPSCKDVQSPECLGDVLPSNMLITGATMCPQQLLRSQPSTLLELDNSYHHSRLCQCVGGFFHRPGHEGECVTAPKNGLCPGGAQSAVRLPTRGFWAPAGGCVDAALEEAHLMQPCLRAVTHVCAPNNTDASKIARDHGSGAHPACMDGYEGRKCGRCADGFYKFGAECRSCPAHGAVVTVAVLSSFALVGMIALAYTLPVAADGAFRVALFAVQLGVVLASVDVASPAFLVDYSNMWSITMFDIAYLGCLKDSFTILDDAEGAMALCAVVVALPCVVFVLGRIVIAGAGGALGADSAGNWLRRNVRAMWILFEMAHLRMLMTLPAVFSCEHDACTDRSFFARAPDIGCTGSALQTRVASVCMFVFGPVLIPVLGFALLHTLRAKGNRAEAWGMDVLSSGFRDGRWWWNAVLMLRKLMLGLFIGLQVSDAAFVPFFVFVFLIASWAVQREVQPFDEGATNLAETYNLAVQSVAFSMVAAFHAPGLSHSVALAVCFLAMQLAAVFPTLMYFISMFLPDTQRAFVETNLSPWSLPDAKGAHHAL